MEAFRSEREMTFLMFLTVSLTSMLVVRLNIKFALMRQAAPTQAHEPLAGRLDGVPWPHY